MIKDRIAKGSVWRRKFATVMEEDTEGPTK
jgi:hypothetical protein